MKIAKAKESMNEADLVIVQGVGRSGDQGRRAIALVLQQYRRLPDRSHVRGHAAWRNFFCPFSGFLVYRGALLGELIP
jgi:hypothetical protein